MLPSEPTQKDLYMLKERILATARRGVGDSVVIWWTVRILEAPSEAVELTILRDLWYWNDEAKRLRRQICADVLALSGHYRKLSDDFEIGIHQIAHILAEE